MAEIKISQLTAKAANLSTTDLFEVSVVSGLSYVSRKITGQEIIDGVIANINIPTVGTWGALNYPSWSSGTPFVKMTAIGTFALDTNTYLTSSSISGLVPYTGATTNVDLGEYELKTGQLTLDISPTGTATVGTTRWNDSIGSSETTLKGGTVVLKNGVDLVARIVNKVTPNTTLTKAAYQAVRVSGAAGQRLAVSLAQANNDANSADTIGLVTETIATNQEGFIITVGQIEDINTTGSLQGETWADGDVLYLSPTTAGKLTNIKPTGATGHIVVIGYVEYAHAIHGKIYVKVMNGWELDELHNVYINPATLANNDGLFYESSTQLWKNKTIATALGYTPVTNARTISTNSPLSGGGDLSANRTLSIADAVADGTTKGAAAFTASDFNSASGVISIDYTNGQAASGSNKGFLTSTDWTTFNNKVNTGAITGSGLTLATNRLLGRTTAGSGAVEEISIGTGLTLSGGTLSSTGGGITVGTTAVTSGTDGRVFFQAGGVIQQDANFTFDNTLKRLTLKAVGTAATDIPFAVQNSAGTRDFMRVRGDGATIIQAQTLSDYTFTQDFNQAVSFIGKTSGNTLFELGNDFNAAPSQLYTGALKLYNWSSVLKTRIQAVGTSYWADSTAVVSIGSSTNGARLDVRAQGALSTDIAFRVRNSADTSNIIAVQGDANIVKGSTTAIVSNVQSVTSAATVTPVYGNDLVKITAQAAALTIANPTGTWTEGKDLMIRIKDNGSAQTISWDTNYRAIGVTLPTTTVINKTTYVGVIYNSTDGKWDVIGVTTEA